MTVPARRVAQKNRVPIRKVALIKKVGQDLVAVQVMALLRIVDQVQVVRMAVGMGLALVLAQAQMRVDQAQKARRKPRKKGRRKSATQVTPQLLTTKL